MTTGSMAIRPTDPTGGERKQIVSNGVLGMLLFVACEIMLFAGMISAFWIVKSSALEWPPPGQPRHR